MKARTDRLAALRRYAVFGTPAEAGFNDLARLAAQLCGTAMSLITFIDATRQSFKARVGFDGVALASLDKGFCPLVVHSAAALVIPDTLAHPKYACNEAVTQDGVRFYAGVPLITAEGYVLGTLSVLDRTPKTLSPEQVTGLHAVADQVVGQLDLRRALLLARGEDDRTLQAAAQANRTRVLAQASVQLLVATDPAEMVRNLFTSVAPAFQVGTCLGHAVQEGGLALVAAPGVAPEQAARVAQLEFGQMVFGMAAASCDVAYVTGIQAGNDRRAAFLKELGLDSCVCLPLVAGGALLGTLAFGRRAGPFPPDS